MTRRLACAGLAFLVAGTAEIAHAQGSGMMTFSGCATGLAGAGVASPCQDGSAAFYNPAGLARQPSLASFGLTSARTTGSFAYDDDRPGVDQDGNSTWLPYGYLNYNISPSLSAALGVFSPYATQVVWPDTFDGRYVSYDTWHNNVYLQPTISTTAGPNFSIGAGVDVIFSNFEINQRLDLAARPLPAGYQSGGTVRTFRDVGVPPQTDFADARLAGRGTGVSFHVGLLGRIGDIAAIGVRYLHSAAIDLEGSADFSPVHTEIVLPPGNGLSVPGNPYGIAAGSAVALDPVLAGEFVTGGSLFDQDVSTNLELPAQFVVGAAITPTPALKFVADYQWTGWTAFDDVRIDFAETTDTVIILDYRNTNSYRAGIEYATSDAFSVRLGFATNAAAQGRFSVSPLLPEGDRRTFSLGSGWSPRPNLSLELGYQLVKQQDRPGRLVGRAVGMTEAQLEALNVGEYSGGMHHLSATLTYRFGPAR